MRMVIAITIILMEFYGFMILMVKYIQAGTIIGNRLSHTLIINIINRKIEFIDGV